MLQIPEEQRLWRAGRAGRPSWRGSAGSLALHLLGFAFVLLILPWLERAPPDIPQPIPINLVRLGPKTTAPPAPVTAPVPQQQAQEVAPDRPTPAIPVPASPPLSPGTATFAAVAPMPATKPEPKSVEPAAPAQAGTPKAKPAPANSLLARLQNLAHLRQPAATVPPDPRKQEGMGTSNTSLGSASIGDDAAYGLKDFIRQQVERHWNPDRGELAAKDWRVSIRIGLSPDGHVRLAEILADPSHGQDAAYRDFALSARNAVLMTSPLALPEGMGGVARNVVVDFRAAEVAR